MAQPGRFSLQRRSFERAIEGGRSVPSFVFDLRIALGDEIQARHFRLAKNPLVNDEFVATIGAGTGRGKLDVGRSSPEKVKPGATGPKASLNPTGGQATIVTIDTGSAVVVSDRQNAKIIELRGRKLRGRFLFVRERGGPRFRVKRIPTQGGATRMTELTTAEKNALPDSSFAIILSGGSKDDDGRTMPRSLRRLPYLDVEGNIDLERANSALEVINGERGGLDVPFSGKESAFTKIVAAIKKSDGDFEPPEKKFSDDGSGGGSVNPYRVPLPFPVLADQFEDGDDVGAEKVIEVIDRLIAMPTTTMGDREKLELIRKRMEGGQVNPEDIAFVSFLRKRSGISLFAAPAYFSSEMPHWPYESSVLETFSAELGGVMGMCRFAADECPAVGAEDRRAQALSCGHAHSFGCPVFLEEIVPVSDADMAAVLETIDFSDNGNKDDKAVDRYPTNFQRSSVDRNEKLGTVDFKGYEVLRVGKWNGIPFTEKDLDEIADNFKKLSTGKNPSFEVPVKIGHHDDQSLLTNSGEAAAGWLGDVYRDGKKLLCDISKMPGKVFQLLERGAFRHRSIEMLKDFKDQGKHFGKALKALSLLGASTPAVKGMQTLDDLLGLYSFESEDDTTVLIFEEDMSDTDKDKKAEEQEKLNAELKEQREALTKEREAMEAERKAVEEERKAFAEERKALKLETARERRDRCRERNVTLYEDLLKKGKMLPRQKCLFMRVMDVVDGFEHEARLTEELSKSVFFEDMDFDRKAVTFSLTSKNEEGEEEKENVSLRSMMVRFFSGLEKQVDLSQSSNDTDEDEKKRKEIEAAGKSDLFSDKLEVKARELMKKAREGDKELDYVDALIEAESELTQGMTTDERVALVNG